jgi:BASS family bile acid:Na+ symporter
MNLEVVQTILLIVYIVLTMFLMGLRLTWSHIRLLSEHRNLLGRTLLVNILIIPAAALLLVLTITLPTDFAIGLFLIAAAPGAPFAPKFAERVRGPFPVAVAMMFVLVVVSLFTIPATVTLILLQEREAIIVFSAIFFMLILVQTSPLLVGIAINSHRETISDRAQKPLAAAANILAIAVIVLIVVTNWGKLSEVDWRMLTAVILLLFASLAFGWLLGGPALLTRRVLAFVTSARNVAVALLVANTTFPQTDADVGIMVFAVAMLIADIALAAYWKQSAPMPV